MIAIYSLDGKTIIGLYTLLEYLELPKLTDDAGEEVFVTCSVL